MRTAAARCSTSSCSMSMSMTILPERQLGQLNSNISVSNMCAWLRQRAALEEVAHGRCNGALRHQLARDLNKSAKDFHYVARVRPARRSGFGFVLGFSFWFTQLPARAQHPPS